MFSYYLSVMVNFKNVIKEDVLAMGVDISSLNKHVKSYLFNPRWRCIYKLRRVESLYYLSKKNLFLKFIYFFFMIINVTRLNTRLN